jgi:hypothetical protein
MKAKESKEKEVKATVSSFTVKKPGKSVTVEQEKIENGYLIRVSTQLDKPNEKKGEKYWEEKKYFSETEAVESEFTGESTKEILSKMGYTI